MILAVKHPLTIPGTLSCLRQGTALTVPGAPVAWSRWGRWGPKTVILRPYKQQYQEGPFELFWTAAGCTQCLHMSGMPFRAFQTLRFEVTWAELQESLTY